MRGFITGVRLLIISFNFSLARIQNSTFVLGCMGILLEKPAHLNQFLELPKPNLVRRHQGKPDLNKVSNWDYLQEAV